MRLATWAGFLVLAAQGCSGPSPAPASAPPQPALSTFVEPVALDAAAPDASESGDCEWTSMDCETAAGVPDSVVYPYSWGPQGTVYVEDLPSPLRMPRCATGAWDYPLHKLCVRGKEFHSGEILTPDTIVMLVQAQGHILSGSLAGEDWKCSATSTAPGELVARTSFCTWLKRPPEVVVSMPPPAAVCTKPQLAPGKYVVRSGKLELFFTLPSMIPLGGVCSTWARRVPPPGEYDWLLHPKKN